MSSFLWQAVEWHFDEIPPSNPYKKYLVVYAPWDFDKKANRNPRFDLADYYPGEEPNRIYEEKPWRFDCCYSAMEKEILCWADVGNVEDVVERFLWMKAEEVEP